MIVAQPLPAYLVQRFRAWKATNHDTNKAWFHRLADSGQHPREMIISCCDSRVHVTTIFSAESGEFFVHRNIANLVPPYEPGGEYHGTSAAIEFAVNNLKIAHLVILGHSNCGGVQHCYDMCEGDAPIPDKDKSFVGRWMDLLRPGFDRLPEGADRDTRMRALEKEAVLVSLANLMTFPFVKRAVDANDLSLHGLWLDIGSARLEGYDPATAGFQPV